MKANGLTVVLSLAVLGLGIGLYYRHDTAVKKYQHYESSIQQLSNQWNDTSAKLMEQKRVNTVLETNLVIRTGEADGLTNRLLSLSNDLVRTETEMKAAAKAAEEEIAKHEAKIKDLENQNDGLSKTMDNLKGNITSLEAKILETQQKLASAQGEKEFLLKELKRLQAEKAELEKQFNDLAVLREQVRKLKDELSVAKRLEWIRKGLYGSSQMKGGQLLQQGFWRPAAAKSNYNLNVEIKRDGETTITPPANPAAQPK